MCLPACRCDPHPHSPPNVLHSLFTPFPCCSGETCDVLAHLSVRSRNMKVLFATCFDPTQLEAVEKLVGSQVAFETNAAGGVKWREVDAAEAAAHKAAGEE